MKKANLFASALLTLVLIPAFSPAWAKKKTEDKTKTESIKKGSTMTNVIIETSMGNIEIELNNEKAPISAENFLKYVDSGHYDGTIFHRVIDNFMIQGGGFSAGMKEKKTGAQIKNEAQNGLKNLRGTLAMARTGVVDSATAQFFINVKDNVFLDHSDPSPRGFGYAVFGKVISGMDVVDKIKVAKTTTKDGMENVPVEDIIIKSMKRK